jgi:hypothetical protein
MPLQVIDGDRLSGMVGGRVVLPVQRGGALGGVVVGAVALVELALDGGLL